MKKVGLLVVATSPLYVAYANKMLESADKYFLPHHHVTYFVFTDGEVKGTERTCTVLPMEHKPWPHSTLQRYDVFVKHAQLFADLDYLFYCDADMLFVDKVGEEILHSLTVVIHPGFNGGVGTPEKRKESTAFVADNEKKQLSYVCGGFNGGEKDHFLKLAATIKERTDIDSDNNIVATWHDESHLNRYILDMKKQLPEMVKYLTPSYCYVYEYKHLRKIKPRLATVSKNLVGPRA